jgi:hypothetical protein
VVCSRHYFSFVYDIHQHTISRQILLQTKTFELRFEIGIHRHWLAKLFMYLTFGPWFFASFIRVAVPNSVKVFSFYLGLKFVHFYNVLLPSFIELLPLWVAASDSGK